MAGSFLKKLFGDSNSAEIKRLEKIAAKIDSYEDAHRRLSEEELSAYIRTLRKLNTYLREETERL